MQDRMPGAPGQYKAKLTAAELQKMQAGEQFTITMTRDDQPIVEGTPYSKAAVLPDELAAVICPGVLNPTPADALGSLQKYAKKVGKPNNLLDNSYFIDPVVQAGVNGLHGTDKYAVDRWRLDNDLTATQTANGLQIVSGGADWWAGIVQHLQTSKLPKNKTMTFAVRGLFQSPMRIYVFGSNVGGSLVSTYADGSSDYKTHIVKFQIPDTFPDDKILISISPDTEGIKSVAILQWAALYEGEYTAENLPEYQPKGYADEWLECRRYYKHFEPYDKAFMVGLTGGKAYISISFEDVPMRTNPSLICEGGFYMTSDAYVGHASEDVTLHKSSANSVTLSCTVPVNATTTATCEKSGSYFALSADL